MKLAELPTPQFCWLAMWPPQAITMAWLALMACERVNFSVTVLVHWPVPPATLSAVTAAESIVEPDGPNRSMVPGTWLPEKVPPAPPQFCCPPLLVGPKFSAGAATFWVAGSDDGLH